MTPQFPSAVDRASLHQVLVVDDEDIVLVALRETLARQGYRVVATSSPLEARDLLRRQAFAVILTDHQMPEMTGLELLAQARELQPDATRILITAVLNLATVIDSINKGEVYRFIIKPWLREELLVTVGNAVQRYELICKNNVLQATMLSMNAQLVRLNEELAHQVGEATRGNQRLAADCQALSQNLLRAIELALKPLASSHPAMAQRAARVHHLCRAMASSLALPVDQQRALEVAAWLHDLGLVGLPPEVVNSWEQSSDTLTETQQRLIQRHPILGQELAAFTEPLADVGPAIRAHHEHCDGSGYPDGIAGESIPWLGRLLAVAVAYVTEAGDPGTASKTLRQGAGSRFDPRAVEALLRILPESRTL
jgi:response regulator RpfG family c-di-GMP phosphodiesterase